MSFGLQNCNLSLNFTIEFDLFTLSDCDRVTMSAFDRTPLGASLLQQLEPTSSKLQNGVIPESSVNQEEDKSTPARPRKELFFTYFYSLN